jgi:uncharacterized protein (TIGR02679 family)
VELLRRPEYRPLWAAARRRLEANGLSLEGSPLRLTGLDAEEADAIAGLLGVRRPAHGSLRVKLGDLDRVLRSSAADLGLLDLLVTLDGELVDRRAARSARDADRAERWEVVRAHPAAQADQLLAEWVEHVRSSGLARRVAGESETAVAMTALDVVAALDGSKARYRLPVLAADLTGDAHGLDRGKAPGTLAVHALAWRDGQAFPRDAADWRRTWSDAGVACDDLSCDVLVCNLPGWPAEPLRLTLRQASAWRGGLARTGTTYVAENPAIIAAAVDELGDDAPTMVCLDGMPSTAALVVLDALAMAGSAIRYHGDFDWRGLTIASVLARKVPRATPWRFNAVDYRAAIDRGLGCVELTGRPSESPWDDELGPALASAGVAVYEEQVLDSLLADLA